jgi:hypothetical protein
MVAWVPALNRAFLGDDGELLVEVDRLVVDARADLQGVAVIGELQGLGEGGEGLGPALVLDDGDHAVLEVGRRRAVVLAREFAHRRSDAPGAPLFPGVLLRVDERADRAAMVGLRHYSTPRCAPPSLG